MRRRAEIKECLISVGKAGRLKVGKLLAIFQSLRDAASPIKIIILLLAKSFLNNSRLRIK